MLAMSHTGFLMSQPGSTHCHPVTQLWDICAFFVQCCRTLCAHSEMAWRTWTVLNHQQMLLGSIPQELVAFMPYSTGHCVEAASPAHQ